jgi:simple sugar transport system permease protein
MNIYNLFQSSFVSIIPLLIVALGALVSERSGVTNIALEGIMLIGGFVGIWIIKDIEVFGLPTQLVFIIGIVVGGLMGMLYSLIHAYASIKMNADQIISATALNLFAPAFVVFTARTIQGGQQVKFTSVFRISEIPVLSDIPIIGDIFFTNAFISTYIGIALLFVVFIFLYRTRTGLRIRSCGENPHAADSLGINIYKLRYFSVLTSGFFAGMGGVIFVATTSNTFDASVAGFGFLSLAVLIFGNWKPFRILGAAIFFGFMRTIASSVVAIPFLNNLSLPSEFYRMIPYIMTLIVLAFFSKNSQAPKAVGQPYDQSKR